MGAFCPERQYHRYFCLVTVTNNYESSTKPTQEEKDELKNAYTGIDNVNDEDVEVVVTQTVKVAVEAESGGKWSFIAAGHT